LTLLLATAPLALLQVVCFGTDPPFVLALTTVSMGFAVLGVSVTAAFSLWARVTENNC
jgi:hypothetical protein